MTNPKKIVSFTIDHLDPMGQGVYKTGSDVYFIPKTLPDEKGEGIVTKSSKGVNFVALKNISETSNKRIEPECPHFSECSGCHYLHTDYEEEKEFKRKSYRKIFGRLLNENQDVDEIWSDKRLHYRNRVQLHYDLKTKKLGFLKTRSKAILEVPNCQISVEEVKSEIANLYKNNNWLKKIKNKNKKPSGHVEIYKKFEDEVKETWNFPYASGGFSQVNHEVNEKMKDYLTKLLSELKFESICDLFGGNGNLSDKLLDGKRERVVVDIYPSKMNSDFYSLNLYEEGSFFKFKNDISRKFDLFLIDPPRSGFKELSQWISHYQPKYLAYISCHPQTQARDLEALEGYKVRKFCLIDLFPSTFHFESLIFLERC